MRLVGSDLGGVGMERILDALQFVIVGGQTETRTALAAAAGVSIVQAAGFAPRD